MVVDDDADIRDSMADVLHDEGYAVEQACNGAEALALLCDDEQLSPCVVFLDMMMPVMTGGQLLTALAARQRLAELAVVVVSASALPADTVGARKVMQKPVTLDAILAAAGEFCDPHAARPPA